MREEVAAGRFRQDLLFRLNTVEFGVPPLRLRRADIMPLAEHFLVQHVGRYRKRIRGFADDAVAALLAHHWPGNVRELDHAVERGVLMASGERLRAADLGLDTGTPPPGPARLDELPLEEVEKLLVEKALARHGGSVSQAAQALGLSRSALYRRLEKHGL